MSTNETIARRTSALRGDRRSSQPGDARRAQAGRFVSIVAKAKSSEKPLSRGSG